MVFAGLSFLAALLAVPRFGLPAAALALTLYISGLNIWELWLVSRALKFSFWRHIAQTAKQIAPPIAAGSLLLGLLAKYWAARGYPELFVHIFLGGGAYAMVSFWTMLSGTERARLIERSRTLVGVRLSALYAAS
jgi:hypothetical protein